MLENLLGTLKSEVGGQILNQTQLPADKLDGVFKVIGDVTKKEVTGQMTGGGIGNLLNLFSNQTNNAAANLIQNNIASGVVSESGKQTWPFTGCFQNYSPVLQYRH